MKLTMRIKSPNRGITRLNRRILGMGKVLSLGPVFEGCCCNDQCNCCNCDCKIDCCDPVPGNHLCAVARNATGDDGDCWIGQAVDLTWDDGACAWLGDYDLCNSGPHTLYLACTEANGYILGVIGLFEFVEVDPLLTSCDPLVLTFATSLTVGSNADVYFTVIEPDEDDICSFPSRCCEDTPRILYATINNTQGCSCLADIVVPLVHTTDNPIDQWIGLISTESCGGDPDGTLQIIMQCTTTTLPPSGCSASGIGTYNMALNFTGGIAGNTACDGGPFRNNTTCSCDPIEITFVFNFGTFAAGQNCCGEFPDPPDPPVSPILTIVVTASP